MRTFSILLILLSMLGGIVFVTAEKSYELGYKRAIRECETAVEESVEYADVVFRFSDGRVAIVHRQWPKKQRLYKAISIYEP